jgi:hypothetical protein
MSKKQKGWNVCHINISEFGLFVVVWEILITADRGEYNIHTYVLAIL